MQFSDVLGQHEIKTYLREIVSQDRVPHALLFLGKPGNGPLPMALAFAQYLMCEKRGQDDACGDCTHCKKNRKYIHPDIHYTYPTIGSKMTSADFTSSWRSFLEANPYGDAFDWFNMLGGDNKQGNITKDECNRILKVLSLKTFEGEYKIHILWMPEYLGAQGNRLLKIIEEPPDSTVFILVAERQEEILNTILSRCQIVSFKPLKDEVIAKQLTDQFEFNHTKSMQIAFLTDGDLNEALKLAGEKDQVLSTLWIDWMRKVYKGYGPDLVAWSDQLNRMDRESQKNLFRYGLHFLHEMLIYELNNHYTPRLLDKEKMAMQKLGALMSISKIEAMIELINLSIFHIERNANSKIIMLDCGIKIHRILRKGEVNRKRKSDANYQN